MSMTRNHCFKCGHNWLPRFERRAALCPNCNYARWDDAGSVDNPVLEDTKPDPVALSSYISERKTTPIFEVLSERLGEILGIVKEIRNNMEGSKGEHQENEPKSRTEEELKRLISRANRELEMLGKGRRKAHKKGEERDS